MRNAESGKELRSSKGGGWRRRPSGTRSVLTAAAGARAAAVTGGGWGTLGPAHNAQASADHTTDRLAGLRVLGKRLVFHGLAHLELFRLLPRLGGDGFVDIRCHSPKIKHLAPDFKKIRREDEVEGWGFEMGGKLSKVGGREAG